MGRKCSHCKQDLNGTQNKAFCSRDCYKESRRDWSNVPYPRIWYKGKREYLHRVIWMEAHPEEELLATDVIHHKDENPFNRDIDNLEKVKDGAEHLARHNYYRHKRVKKEVYTYDEDVPF